MFGRILARMTALTDFLLARFNDDIVTARDAGPEGASRILVDVAVKRELVEKWLDGEPYGPQDPTILELLAWPYATHPDHRPEWLPVPVQV